MQVFLFFTSTVFAASLAIANVVNVYLSAKDTKTVETAIMRACQDKDWTPVKKPDNIITATLHVIQHMIVVDINYSKTGYSITYKDSVNMQYNASKNKIHAKYSAWVANFSKSIKGNIVY
ncbi:hypothetical protein [Endomicrobium proavitum]|uniref:Putative lipoprotein n=1 Tax=Endomicrobium proavitum TaxID=1408281 RepID=A0A0G3WLD8_9BACT|nr:hypothetical protein [Endomicrobium proavitum]AKL98324.1 putative lipoprotein [Endomicrobium proavitum]